MCTVKIIRTKKMFIETAAKNNCKIANGRRIQYSTSPLVHRLSFFWHLDRKIFKQKKTTEK